MVNAFWNSMWKDYKFLGLWEGRLAMCLLSLVGKHHNLPDHISQSSPGWKTDSTASLCHVGCVPFHHLFPEGTVRWKQSTGTGVSKSLSGFFWGQNSMVFWHKVERILDLFQYFYHYTSLDFTGKKS